MQHNNCTLAVKGGDNILGELTFGTFFSDRKSHVYGPGYSSIIRDNIYFDMDAYPLAKLDFVSRSGLLPKEQLITPEPPASAIPAKDAQYIDAKIFEVKGIFTKHQIDRETLPKGLYAYDIQYSRDEMMPECIWNRVLGRRFGTVITKKPLTIGEKGYTDIKDTDFTLNPAKRCTLRDFQNRSRERDR
jgi:hypothetical protein